MNVDINLFNKILQLKYWSILLFYLLSSNILLESYIAFSKSEFNPFSSIPINSVINIINIIIVKFYLIYYFIMNCKYFNS